MLLMSHHQFSFTVKHWCRLWRRVGGMGKSNKKGIGIPKPTGTGNIAQEFAKHRGHLWFFFKI